MTELNSEKGEVAKKEKTTFWGFVGNLITLAMMLGVVSLFGSFLYQQVKEEERLTEQKRHEYIAVTTILKAGSRGSTVDTVMRTVYRANNGVYYAFEPAKSLEELELAVLERNPELDIVKAECTKSASVSICTSIFGASHFFDGKLE